MQQISQRETLTDTSRKRQCKIPNNDLHKLKNHHQPFNQPTRRTGAHANESCRRKSEWFEKKILRDLAWCPLEVTMSSITKVELQVVDDKLLVDAILADKLPAEVGEA